ncbi:hypothetical protein, partial [Streptomyces violaceorubidus]|uniref:hypothetical protein n=1 Tax=Streptomyces violaceorubidus TaxID=284042 RepID=UPI001ADEDDE6
GTWENGRPRLAFPKERPISKYGETDANEDLAETANYYFHENALLREKAPLRAEFFDRLIAGWRQRGDSADRLEKSNS